MNNQEEREYIIEYISYEGRRVHSNVSAVDEESAWEEFWKEQGEGVYSGNLCHKIIGIS